MASTTTVTRRSFLKRSAAAGLAGLVPYVLTSSALSAPASDRILTGHIGVGGMGSGHLRGDGIASADPYMRHAQRAARRMAKDCAAYQDYRRILERKDIDAVIIATPDHWHALASIHAMQAGKDVYCEKPLSLTIEQGRAMVTAARRYNRVFQTGSQQRSGGEFIRAVELVRNGRIGTLKRIHVGIGGSPACGWDPDTKPPDDLDWNLWLGPAAQVPFNPKRFLFSFRWFWEYSGGMMTDWGQHHNDIAQWGNGTSHTGPVEVEGTGRYPADGLFETCTWFQAQFRYANGVTLATDCEGPWGVTFYGTKGEVFVKRGQWSASDGVDTSPVPPSGVQIRRPRGGHMGEWLTCIKTREKANADVEIGHRSCTVCHIANIAIRLRRKLRWNPDAERFIGDDEANRWISRPMRSPWKL